MSRVAREFVEVGPGSGRTGLMRGPQRAYLGLTSAPRRFVLAGVVLLAVFTVLLASGAAAAFEATASCERVVARADLLDPVGPASEPPGPDCLRCCVIHCQTLPPATRDPVFPDRPRPARYVLSDDAAVAFRAEAADPPPRV